MMTPWIEPLNRCLWVMARGLMIVIAGILMTLIVREMPRGSLLGEMELELEKKRTQLPEHAQNDSFKQEVRDLDYFYRRLYQVRADEYSRAQSIVLIAGALLLAVFMMIMVLQRFNPERPKRDVTQTPSRLFYPLQVAFVVFLLGGVALWVAWRYQKDSAGAKPLLVDNSPEVLNASNLAQASVPFSASQGVTQERQTNADFQDSVSSTTGDRANKAQEDSGQSQSTLARVSSALAVNPDCKSVWSQFRGGWNEVSLPFPSKIKETWKIKVPLSGFSSPLLVDSKVIITGADKRTRTVFAFNEKDGSVAWRYDLPTHAGRLPDVTEDTGYAAATPATAAGRVFAIFATGQMVCLNVIDGSLLWSYSFEVPEILYGYANSLLVHNGRLIVQFDTQKQHILYAFDVTNGKEIWRNERADHTASSWASPALLPLKEKDKWAIVTLSNQYAEGFDFETGKTLWMKDCMSGEIASSPATHPDYPGKLFLANSGGAAMAFDALTGEELWKNEDALLPDVSSPMVAGKQLLIFTGSGVCSALKLEDGTGIWEQEFDEGFYATPLVAGDRALVAGRSGKLTFFKTDSDQFEVLGTYEVGEPVLASPVSGYHGLFIRSFSHLLKMEAVND